MKLELSHPFNKELIIRDEFSISNEANYRDLEFFILIREVLDKDHKSPLDEIKRTDAHIITDFGRINLGEVTVDPHNTIVSNGFGTKWRTYALTSTKKVKRSGVVA